MTEGWLGGGEKGSKAQPHFALKSGNWKCHWKSGKSRSVGLLHYKYCTKWKYSYVTTNCTGCYVWDLQNICVGHCSIARWRISACQTKLARKLGIILIMLIKWCFNLPWRNRFRLSFMLFYVLCDTVCISRISSIQWENFYHGLSLVTLWCLAQTSILNYLTCNVGTFTT